MLILFILFIVGIIAGFINTLAGGGSTLTLPVLILAGMPSPMANATNRIAILFQNSVAVQRFHKHKKLDIKNIRLITLATIIGSVFGALFAANIKADHFDTILGFVFLIILILMLIPHHRKAKNLNLPKQIEFIIFLGVGFYGGFIQAGIGFILLATLNLVEDFDLIRANAAKVFIIICYTIFAVLIFSFSGKIIWKYGLILALGNMIGAFLGVKAAIQKGEKFVKIIIATAVIIASLKLFGFFELIGL